MVRAPVGSHDECKKPSKKENKLCCDRFGKDRFLMQVLCTWLIQYSFWTPLVTIVSWGMALLDFGSKIRATSQTNMNSTYSWLHWNHWRMYWMYELVIWLDMYGYVYLRISIYITVIILWYRYNDMIICINAKIANNQLASCLIARNMPGVPTMCLHSFAQTPVHA